MGPIALRSLAIGAAAITIGCSHPPPPETPPRIVATAADGRGVLDLAADFLDTACKAPAGEPFARAWLAHEERFHDVYFPAYYPDAGDAAERPRIAADLALRKDEMCGHARIFRLVGASTLDALRPEVTRVIGAAPKNPVVFAAALQWTDGRVTDVGGRPTLVLNARHESFARTERLGILVAHELTHDAQENLYAGRDEALSPAARGLYREGCAVFATTLIFPEVGDRALSFSSKDLERGRFALKKAAAGLLELVRTRAASRQMGHYFRGGKGDDEMPARMAYFVGLEVFRAIAHERGELAAARISPEAFAAELERRLADLAR